MTDFTDAYVLLGSNLEAWLEYTRAALVRAFKTSRILRQFRLDRASVRPRCAIRHLPAPPTADPMEMLQAISSISATYSDVRSDLETPDPGVKFVSNAGQTEALCLVRLTDGRLGIEKTIVDSSRGKWTLWLNEILFYAYLRDKISRPELYIPELLRVELVNQSTTRLTISFVPQTQRISSFESGVVAAREFGEMAARAHLDRSFEMPWLPRARPLHPIRADRRADLSELFGMIGRPDLYDRFTRLGRIRDAVLRMNDRGLETICHADAHRENLRERANGRGYLLIDWACVNRGMIGHDLSRLAYPSLIWHLDWKTIDELISAEDNMLEAYICGVNNNFSNFDPDVIICCFHIATASFALSGFPRQAIDVLKKTQDKQRHEYLCSKVRGFYELTIGRIDQNVVGARQQP